MEATGSSAKAVRPDVPGIEAFTPALRRYFARRALPGDVEDLVQEVLVRMQGRQNLAPIDNLQGYVFTVAANVFKEVRRKAGSSPLVHGEFELPDELTPERIVLARSEAARLVEAIERLPPRTREIFAAHRFEDMTYAAISSLFGISVSAVEKHIMAALRSLAVAVGRNG